MEKNKNTREPYVNILCNAKLMKREVTSGIDNDILEDGLFEQKN